MIRTSAWTIVFLLLAVAASPAAASGIPAGATMMPLAGESSHTGGSASGCNCAPPSATAAAMARTAALPRTAGGSEAPSCNGSSLPMVNGASGPAGRVSGIRRIYPRNVLDHPERAAVYRTIIARPGIDLAGIASELGMNRETLRYHLDQLESAAKVVVMRDHGIVRYYENHGRYTPLQRNVVQHLWNPTAERILSFISTTPGITQAEVAVHLAVTAPTVRWYMHRFREDGIISEWHHGRYTRYALTEAALPFVTCSAAIYSNQPSHGADGAIIS